MPPRTDPTRSLGPVAGLQANAHKGNVLSAKAPNEKIPFIADSDLDIYTKYRDAAFEVQVGLHELTGTSGAPTTLLRITNGVRSWMR